jgi:ribosomal protein L21E
MMVEYLHPRSHARAGTVFNVTQHAVGVIVNKRVRTRVIAKRIHVRIEHVSKSKSRENFVAYVVVVVVVVVFLVHLGCC